MCLEHTLGDKSILRFHLGETSIDLFQGGQAENVFVSNKRAGVDAAQRVNPSKRRSCLMHVAMICDRPDVQPLPPQYVISNGHTFKARMEGGRLASRLGNVRLVRQKSAWSK